MTLFERLDFARRMLDTLLAWGDQDCDVILDCYREELAIAAACDRPQPRRRPRSDRRHNGRSLRVA